MKNIQNNNTILNVYFFYGESDTSSEWCLGFDCDSPIKIIDELNTHMFVHADKKPSRWKDKNGKEYKFIMLLGDKKVENFDERKKLSKKAIEDITGKTVVFHEIS